MATEKPKGAAAPKRSRAKKPDTPAEQAPADAPPAQLSEPAGADTPPSADAAIDADLTDAPERPTSPEPDAADEVDAEQPDADTPEPTLEPEPAPPASPEPEPLALGEPDDDPNLDDIPTEELVSVRDTINRILASRNEPAAEAAPQLNDLLKGLPIDPVATAEWDAAEAARRVGLPSDRVPIGVNVYRLTDRAGNAISDTFLVVVDDIGAKHHTKIA